MRIPPEFLCRALLSSTTFIYIHMYIWIHCTRQYLMQREKNRAQTNVLANIYRIDANAVKYFRVDGYVCRMQLATPRRRLGVHSVGPTLLYPWSYFKWPNEMGGARWLCSRWVDEMHFGYSRIAQMQLQLQFWHHPPTPVLQKREVKKKKLYINAHCTRSPLTIPASSNSFHIIK